MRRPSCRSTSSRPRSASSISVRRRRCRIIYFLIILLLSWLFYTLMMRQRGEVTMRARFLVPAIYIIFLLLPIYWLLNMSFKTTNEILGGFTLWPHSFTLENYRDHLHRPDLVQWLHRLARICGHQHRPLGFGGAAGRLRLLALPFPRRQAPVLLAADQPHGAAGGVRAALLPALFRGRPVRHALGGGPRPYPVQHPARGVDPRRLHVRRAEGAGRDRLCRRLFLLAILHPHLHADHRRRASAWPASSASCSPGSSCCSPRP